MEHLFKKIIFFLLALILLNAPAALAETPAPSPTNGSEKNSVGSLLHEAGVAASFETSNAESGNTSVATVAGGIIRVFLSILGVIFIILLIYGGYLWMNSRGSEEQVTKAQEIIKNAVIGLIIVVSAYAITYFVLSYMTRDYIKNGL